MSSKIILFPVGSNIARKHYANSIKITTKVENLSEYLDLDGLNSIYYGENCEVALWGLGSTKRLYNIYCRIEKNDIVMFIQNGQIISFAMVLMKIESFVISEKYWDSNEWSNIILLTAVKENMTITARDIWRCQGYKDYYVLRSPLVISGDKSTDILNNDNEIKNALNEWIELSNQELPDKEEKSKDELILNPRIFISYSHADERYKDELKKHLCVLIRIWNAAYIWDDRNLEAGTDFNNQIDKAMMEANILILLISADYIESNACMSEFDNIILQQGDKIIIPIIVRNCYWEKLFFKKGFNVITFPENKSNIYKSDDKDEEYKKIVEYIDEAIEIRLNNKDE